MKIALVDPGDPLVLAAGESGVRDGAPFAFAGPRGALDRAGRRGADGALFGSKSGNPVETCTILTTAANAAVAAARGRMPVILPPGAYGPGLAGKDIPLGPCPADDMHAHPVSHTALGQLPLNADDRLHTFSSNVFLGQRGAVPWSLSW